ncbi:hypothetical protein [Aminobacter sp. MET-1]|uniref:hypothetical protein n=1 Tax=Aminobacter sp. MET-1 TaxID=2951085 RepID=UPI00226A0377|nr:hypothetical protein [Aminobacter sp. MET-1]MCX8567660.1 hypothetical protein [Aminobacter sp. MET-1]
MEHIAALLLVVSCSPDLSGCREIPAPTPLFEVFEDCQAELPQAIRTLAPKHPRLFAKCLEVDPALEDDYDQLTWNVLPNGTLEAKLSVSEVITASGTPDTSAHAH